MEERIVITVDGLAGTGKSSAAKLLADRLGFSHLNSGLLYRGIALLVEREAIDISNEKSLNDAINEHKLELISSVDSECSLHIDGETASAAKLNSPRISALASEVGSFRSVREYLVIPQRGAMLGRNIVAEGRDMGTVIFPDAALKFFIEAKLEVRAERRLAQLGGDKQGRSIEDIVAAITERDERDSKRAESPILMAKDALLIDNSNGTLEMLIDLLELNSRQRLAI